MIDERTFESQYAVLFRFDAEPLEFMWFDSKEEAEEIYERYHDNWTQVWIDQVLKGLDLTPIFRDVWK